MYGKSRAVCNILIYYNNFLIVSDITAGYRHLRDNNYAHRDIKPDNIMISFSASDGTEI